MTRISTSGREPGRLGLDLDERRGELGEDVELGLDDRPRAGDQHHRRVRTTIATRRRSDVETSQRIICRSELGAEELGRAGRDDVPRRTRPRLQRRRGCPRRGDLDPAAGEDVLAWTGRRPRPPLGS